MRFSFPRSVPIFLILWGLIFVLPTLATIAHSGLDRSNHGVEEARSDALRAIKNPSYESSSLVWVGIPEKKALALAGQPLKLNLLLLACAVVIAVILAWFLGNFMIMGKLKKPAAFLLRLSHGDLEAPMDRGNRQGPLGLVGKTSDEMTELLGTTNAEHEKAEEKIEKTAKEWQATFDSITDPVILLDTECRIVRVNKETLRFFNLPRDRMIGQSYDVLIPEKYLTRRAIQTKSHQETEVYFTEKDSWLLVSADPILDPKGETAGLVLVTKDISHRKRWEEALREAEDKFRTLSEEPLVGVYLHQDGIWRYVNKKFAEIHNYTVEEMVDRMRVTDLVVMEDIPLVEENLKKAYSGDVTHYEVRERTKDGRVINVELVSSLTTYQGRPATMGTALDITGRKRAEQELRESEEIFRQLAENVREVFYIGKTDESNIQELCYVSPAYSEIWGRTCESFYRDPQSFFEAVHPEDKDRVKESLDGKKLGAVEEIYRIVRPDGSIRWVTDRSFPIYDSSGEVHRIVGIAADITDLKAGEEKLRYLTLHDSLTGLYNRIYFDEEIKRIEKTQYRAIGIISCDLDGLKLVNDTLGHDQGDNLLVAAAGVIRESFREGDLVARIGGDEFSIILPNATESTVRKACQRIQESVDNYNILHPGLPLSISVGFAVSDGAYQHLRDLLRDADRQMYRKKLYHAQGIRSSLVQRLIDTLKARNIGADRHVTRLENLLMGMAALTGLPESAHSDLLLLAKFHDIGKVGIPDSILLKKGPLTSVEWTEVKRHCEIGYRIALSAPELIPIADWILKHHEWWNGQGYPLGIQGEEIPVECRMLAIADAYEALTSVRPYRRAFSHAEAVAELLSHIGTQFDPRLLETFVQMVEAGLPESGFQESSAI